MSKIGRTFYYSRYVYDLKTVISHEDESLGLIIDFVKSEKPQIIVELGTAYYGLTLLLHECNKNTPLFTFDKYDPRLHITRAKRLTTKTELEIAFKRGFGNTVTFVNADILKHQNIFLIALLEMPYRKILYCDNGKKTREVSYYGPHLNKGDILGVHDWGTEISLKNPAVRRVLELYEDHPINKEFEEKKLLTRFFVKVGE